MAKSTALAYALTRVTDKQAEQNHSYQGDRHERLRVWVETGTVDKVWQFKVTNANLQLLAVYADVPMTIKANNATSPSDTLTLKADANGRGVPYIYHLNGYAANPFASQNVNSIHVTNTSGTDGELSLEVLEDTP